MSNRQYPDDEIDLRDYIEVMIKRKKTILIIFLICVIITIVISFLIPKVYEATTIIKIGGVTQPLISKEEAVIRLKTESLLNPVIQELKLNINTHKFKKMIKIEDTRGEDLIKMKIQYTNPDLVVRICNAVADSFILKEKEIYDKQLTFLKEQIDILEKRNESIEKEIGKLNQTISSQTINPDFPLIQNTLSNYGNTLDRINEKIYLLREQLMNSQQFEILESAITARNIKPNKKLNIGISAFLGLVIGIFTAFLREYWEKGRNSKMK